MGAIFSSQPINKLDREILIELNSNTFKDIYDSIETIHYHYPKSQLLSLEDFSDIFSNLCSESDPLFNRLSTPI